MAILSSIFQSKFRRIFSVLFILSSALPLLVMIFILYKHVVPMLDQTQLYALRPIFTYGMIAMLIPAILSLGMGYQWIGSIEKLSKEIKTKSAHIRGEGSHFNKDQSELADIQETFTEVLYYLKNRMNKLDNVTEQLLGLSIKLEKMVTKDSLTSLYNRRYFDLRLIEETSRSDKDKQELSLIMIDFDNFKHINDSYGHQTGDKLLQEVAAIIKTSLRRSDIVFRYGGDEFAALLPGCEINKAVQIANNLVTKVSEAQLSSSKGELLDGVTISCGIAKYKGNLESFIAEADNCLFAAKGAGRDCVVIS